MKMKNKILMLATSALISTSLVHSTALADSVTVERGDTLWSLSKENNTTVKTIQSLNNLKTSNIYIGQKLVVSSTKNTSNVSPAKTYTVSKGDTLSSIGRKHNIPYTLIKEWNNLKSNTIYIGQKLILTETEAAPIKEKSQPVVQNNDIVSFAKQFVGVPYAWGGTTPKGFDCSGYIYYVLKSEGLVNSRLSTTGYWSKVNKISAPVAGDLIFFQNTYKSGPSHMGIYIGNGEFIHAGSRGIEITKVNNSYWKKHFLGYGKLQ